jgi:hypothetical protein
MLDALKYAGRVAQRHVVACYLVLLSIACAAMALAPGLAEASGEPGLAEAFNPKTTAEELLTKLGPVGIAVVAIFVAVFLFTVGLHFFRRHGKSMAT